MRKAPSNPDAASPGTLDRLFAVAEAMETEAARRYAAMAETMDAAGNAEVAKLFRELERAEQGHARHVADWAEATRDRRCRRPRSAGGRPKARILGDLDRDPRLLTPYRALSVAVHNEERAFSFYSYAAADANDEAVRQQAEAFAREELGHAAWLRRERRRAYRAEGRGRRWSLGGERPTTLGDFLVAAAALERALAERHAACAATLRAAGDPAAEAVAEVVRLDRAEAERLEAALPPGADRPVVHPPATPARTPADCALDLEEAYVFYTAAADLLVTEEALREAQALAESAIARIARLRAAGEPGPSLG